MAAGTRRLAADAAAWVWRRGRATLLRCRPAARRQETAGCLCGPGAAHCLPANPPLHNKVGSQFMHESQDKRRCNDTKESHPHLKAGWPPPQAAPPPHSPQAGPLQPPPAGPPRCARTGPRRPLSPQPQRHRRQRCGAAVACPASPPAGPRRRRRRLRRRSRQRQRRWLRGRQGRGPGGGAAAARARSPAGSTKGWADVSLKWGVRSGASLRSHVR